MVMAVTIPVGIFVGTGKDAVCIECTCKVFLRAGETTVREILLLSKPFPLEVQIPHDKEK